MNAALNGEGARDLRCASARAGENPLFVSLQHLDFDGAGILNDMGVGDDIPVGVHDDAHPVASCRETNPMSCESPLPTGSNI